ATDYFGQPLIMLRRGFGGHVSGSPVQGHSRAAVSIIVDEEFFIELFRSKHKARIPVRAKADSRADHSIPGCLDQREFQWRAGVCGECRDLSRNPACRASVKSKPQQRCARTFYQGTSIHAIAPRYWLIEYMRY